MKPRAPTISLLCRIFLRLARTSVWMCRAPWESRASAVRNPLQDVRFITLTLSARTNQSVRRFWTWLGTLGWRWLLTAPRSLWSGFPLAGKATLEAALKAEKVLRFGQVLVSQERVWHRDNAGNSVAIASPEELRAKVREEPFRPVPTSIDLPAGWHVQLEHPTHAHAVLETIYPGLVADWSACRQYRFETEPLPVTSERQQGMFKGIHKLASDVIENAVATVCGSCIRQPTWWRADFKADLPCGAACNFWLSKAIKLGETTI